MFFHIHQVVQQLVNDPHLHRCVAIRWQRRDLPHDLAHLGGDPGQFAVLFDECMNRVTGDGLRRFLQVEVLLEHPCVGVAQVLHHFGRDALLDQLNFHHKDVVVIRLVQQGFKLQPDAVLGHPLVQLPDQVLHHLDPFLFIVDQFAHNHILYTRVIRNK